MLSRTDVVVHSRRLIHIWDFRRRRRPAGCLHATGRLARPRVALRRLARSEWLWRPILRSTRRRPRNQAACSERRDAGRRWPLTHRSAISHARSWCCPVSWPSRGSRCRLHRDALSAASSSTIFLRKCYCCDRFFHGINACREEIIDLASHSQSHGGYAYAGRSVSSSTASPSRANR